MPDAPYTLIVEVATTPSSQVPLGQVPSELQAYQLTIGNALKRTKFPPVVAADPSGKLNVVLQ